MWQQIHSIGMGHPPDISRGCDASKTFQNTERALESFSKPPLSLFHIYTLTHTHGVYELSVWSKPTDSLLVQLKLPKYLGRLCC